MKVFLGGTVNDSKWRDYVMPKLKIAYFDPVVKDWNEAAMQQEIYEREHCDYCLYVLTPKLTGYYSIAEVIDDSFKRPDRTIYCYLEKDEDSIFSELHLKTFHTLGKRVEKNGGTWLKSLDEIIAYLNSSIEIEQKLLKDAHFDDVFISYGRKHSKDFATRLYARMQEQKYEVWFDQNDIPLGVDFQEQINDGIRRAHNFVFVISPHSVRSEYCLKEILLALELNKRIIPLLHVEPKDDWDKMHPIIQKLNWIYFQDGINDFETSFNGLVSVIEMQKTYVELHTIFLNKAMDWNKNHRPDKILLGGEELALAQRWLHTNFADIQAPCILTDLHCEFITQSIRYSNKGMTDIFFSYARENKDIRDKIRVYLTRKGITSWTDTTDIKTGVIFAEAIQKGIEEADNILFLISPQSVISEYCLLELKMAVKLHKRIIPVLIDPVADNQIPQALKKIQYVTLTTKDEVEYATKLGETLAVIHNERDYFRTHKDVLVKALEWERKQQAQINLLHGFELQKASNWLEANNTRKTDTPTLLHKEYINKSKTSQTSAFISYGRKHSKHFATKLYEHLTHEGFNVWFDQNNIPLGVDFQEQIDDGIEKSDNFIYIISPHAVKSEYCLKEVVLALKYNKRIIPILHVEPSDCWNLMHPVIAKLNWIYSRQKEDFEKPLSQWESIDSIDSAFAGLVTLINTHADYIRIHTDILHKARLWIKNQYDPAQLLVGNSRTQAEQWLATEFEKTQPPCFPTDLHCEFICESKKNASNAMTEVFLCYAREDKEMLLTIKKGLHRFGITTWADVSDINSGVEFEDAIKEGIEQADNFVFLISPSSIASAYCLDELNYVKQFNKRIIPVLISATDHAKIPAELLKIQYIDFTKAFIATPALSENTEPVVVSMQQKVEKDVESRKEKTPIEKAFSEIIKVLSKDRDYHRQHKVFLAQAIRWKSQNVNSMLLRGTNLDGAEAWLKIGDKRPENKPIEIQRLFITQSREKSSTLTTEVFISYSRANTDFARKLNDQLQIHGKTTWFDQESVMLNDDAANETKNGIEQAENFLFIISAQAIKSPYCEQEIEHAKKLNKRIITVLYEEIPLEEIHPELAKIQWINFRPDEVDFSKAFNDLLAQLDTDREHIKNHTKWQQRAKDWEGKNRPADLLIRGVDLKVAQEWLDVAVAKEKQPPPTPLHKEFIERSNEAVLAALRKERQRRLITRLLAVMAAMFILALIATIFAIKQTFVAREKAQEAMVQKTQADSAKAEAVIQREIADSLKTLAEASADTANEQKDFALMQERRARLEKQKALEQEREALRMKNLAEESSKRANVEREKAEASEKNANRANELSIFQLYRFNANNFANKAITMQVTPDNRELNAVLALTAYELRTEAQRRGELLEQSIPDDPELVEALQNAILNYKPDKLMAGEIWSISINDNDAIYSIKQGQLSMGQLTINQPNDIPTLTARMRIDLNSTDFVHTTQYNSDKSIAIAGTSSGKIVVMQVDGKNPRIINAHTANVWSLKFIPGTSNLISSSADNSIAIWDVQTKKLITKQQVTSPIISAVISPEKHLLGIDRNNTIVHINLNNNELNSNQLILNNYKPNTIASHSSNKWLIVGCNKGEILYCQPSSNLSGLDQTIEFPLKHKGMVSLIAFSDNAKQIATAGLDGSVMIWNISGKKPSEIPNLVPILINNGGRKIISLCFSSDGNYVIFGDNQNLHIRPVNASVAYKNLRGIVGNKNMSDNEWNYYKRGTLEKPKPTY